VSLRLRAALAATLTFLSGCATPIVDVVVRADAPSVRVLEGTRTLAAGRPPLTLHLPADVDHDLVVTAEGREAKPVRVASTVSGARVAVYVVQCIFGVGLVLMPIVLSRGVLRTLDPTEVDVQLAHGESPGPTAARPVVSPTPAAAATPPSVPPAFCATCGAQLSKGAAFCGGCGARTRR
jgi:hypothetical protein